MTTIQYGVHCLNSGTYITTGTWEQAQELQAQIREANIAQFNMWQPKAFVTLNDGFVMSCDVDENGNPCYRGTTTIVEDDTTGTSYVSNPLVPLIISNSISQNGPGIIPYVSPQGTAAVYTSTTIITTMTVLVTDL